MKALGLTEFVEANGIRFAYRRFGAKSGVPPVFFQHSRPPATLRPGRE
jgi:hypothetical protein